jgi:hypothetical protein
MTKRITANYTFCNVGNRKVELQFAGGDITSDGGVLLLREADKRTGLMRAVSKIFPDRRDQSKVEHSIESMLKQRVYGLALGYEDLNDHNTLRKCPAFQASVGQTREMASAPTLCRLENSSQRELAVDVHKVLVENFIYPSPFKFLVRQPSGFSLSHVLQCTLLRLHHLASSQAF